ncbi:hypothetical protein D3C75_511410 [compost metagenome]
MILYPLHQLIQPPFLSSLATATLHSFLYCPTRTHICSTVGKFPSPTITIRKSIKSSSRFCVCRYRIALRYNNTCFVIMSSSYDSCSLPQLSLLLLQLLLFDLDNDLCIIGSHATQYPAECLGLHE